MPSGQEVVQKVVRELPESAHEDVCPLPEPSPFEDDLPPMPVYACWKGFFFGESLDCNCISGSSKICKFCKFLAGSF